MTDRFHVTFVDLTDYHCFRGEDFWAKLHAIPRIGDFLTYPKYRAGTDEARDHQIKFWKVVFITWEYHEKYSASNSDMEVGCLPLSYGEYYKQRGIYENP